MPATDNVLALIAMLLIVSHGTTAIVFRVIYVGRCDSKQPTTPHQRFQGRLAWMGLVTAFLATVTTVDPIVNPGHIPFGWMMAFILAMANIVMVTSGIQRQTS